ncbi:MAG: hypothetical protein H7Y00_08170, partial [Fimbriimonadaceae bacterium]|nr:hypothetical protein [Chitinophagales bacterium]
MISVTIFGQTKNYDLKLSESKTFEEDISPIKGTYTGPYQYEIFADDNENVFVTGYREKSYFIQSFDKGLTANKFVYIKNSDVKDINFLKFIFLKNNLYSVQINESKKSNRILLQKINSNDLTFEGEPVILFDNGSQKIENYFFIISPNRSKFGIVFKTRGGTFDKILLKISVFNETTEIERNEDYSLNYDEWAIKNLRFTLSNNGDIYFNATVFNKKVSVANDPDNEALILFWIINGSNKLNEFNFGRTNLIMKDLGQIQKYDEDIVVFGNGRLKDSKSGLVDFLFITLNISSNEISDINIVDIPKDEIIKYAKFFEFEGDTTYQAFIPSVIEK